jgi:hypothetical protein
MKKFKTESLIDQLEQDVKQISAAAEHLRTADPVKLSYCPEEGQWSVSQVIEHLNMYSRHYLPLIERSMVPISKDTNAWFVSGFWGNYFTKMMMPRNVYEIRNKMKTPKSFVPGKGSNVEQLFQEFLQHQQKLSQLLEVARRRNLNTIHIPVTINRFIRLRLGDIFRFLVAHEQRHMIQARNAVKAVGISTDKFPVILEAARL